MSQILETYNPKGLAPHILIKDKEGTLLYEFRHPQVNRTSVAIPGLDGWGYYEVNGTYQFGADGNVNFDYANNPFTPNSKLGPDAPPVPVHHSEEGRSQATRGSLHIDKRQALGPSYYLAGVSKLFSKDTAHKWVNLEFQVRSISNNVSDNNRVIQIINADTNEVLYTSRTNVSQLDTGWDFHRIPLTQAQTGVNINAVNRIRIAIMIDVLNSVSRQLFLDEITTNITENEIDDTFLTDDTGFNDNTTSNASIQGWDIDIDRVQTTNVFAQVNSGALEFGRPAISTLAIVPTMRITRAIHKTTNATWGGCQYRTLHESGSQHDWVFEVRDINGNVLTTRTLQHSGFATLSQGLDQYNDINDLFIGFYMAGGGTPTNARTVIFIDSFSVSSDIALGNSTFPLPVQLSNESLQNLKPVSWELRQGINTDSGNVTIVLQDHDHQLIDTTKISRPSKIKQSMTLELWLGKSTDMMYKAFAGEIQQIETVTPTINQEFIQVVAFGWINRLAHKYVNIELTQDKLADGIALDETDNSLKVSEIIKQLLTTTDHYIVPARIDTNEITRTQLTQNWTTETFNDNAATSTVFPLSIAVTSNRVFVLNNFRIRVYQLTNLSLIAPATTGIISDNPHGMAANGNTLYISNTSREVNAAVLRIMNIDPTDIGAVPAFSGSTLTLDDFPLGHYIVGMQNYNNQLWTLWTDNHVRAYDFAGNLLETLSGTIPINDNTGFAISDTRIYTGHAIYDRTDPALPEITTESLTANSTAITFHNNILYQAIRQTSPVRHTLYRHTRGADTNVPSTVTEETTAIYESFNVDNVKDIDIKLPDFYRYEQTLGTLLSELAQTVAGVYTIDADKNVYLSHYGGDFSGMLFTNDLESKEALNWNHAQLGLLTNTNMGYHDSVVGSGYTHIIATGATRHELGVNIATGDASIRLSQFGIMAKIPPVRNGNINRISVFLSKPAGTLIHPLNISIIGANEDGTPNTQAVLSTFKISRHKLNRELNVGKFIEIQLPQTIQVTPDQVIYLLIDQYPDNIKYVGMDYNTADGTYYEVRGDTLTERTGNMRIRTYAERSLHVIGQNTTARRAGLHKETTISMSDFPDEESAVCGLVGMLDTISMAQREYTTLKVTAPDSRIELGKTCKIRNKDIGLDTYATMIALTMSASVDNDNLVANTVDIEVKDWA